MAVYINRLNGGDITVGAGGGGGDSGNIIAGGWRCPDSVGTNETWYFAESQAWIHANGDPEKRYYVLEVNWESGAGAWYINGFLYYYVGGNFEPDYHIEGFMLGTESDTQLEINPSQLDASGSGKWGTFTITK